MFRESSPRSAHDLETPLPERAQAARPQSPDACHKPARGAFSKYCSDECGVQYMHMRISLWVENGGNRDRLWETVKNAERREGVVVSARA
jgi:COMPASS component SPP1